MVRGNGRLEDGKNSKASGYMIRRKRPCLSCVHWKICTRKMERGEINNSVVENKAKPPLIRAVTEPSYSRAARCSTH